MRWRRVAFGFLIAFYVLTPLLEVGGRPALQLDVQRRRFYLFGYTFNAQDFWMVLLLVLAFAFGLLFVTAWRGRVWCGWGCPQTVFLEGVYRPIERLIDGPRERRLRRQAEPWGAKKLLRAGFKQLVFGVVSLNIAHAAAAIFVGPRELLSMILEGPALHVEAFLLVMGFTALLTLNFVWFREQFCVVLCPYGRLQSVLHDHHSVVVAYDARRGEPRGKPAKGGAGSASGQRGDCIDCKRCVVVCPTAIDIRDGLQMECLACHQCIDACDEVMAKIKRPPGLIGFRSEAEAQGQPRRTLRPRLVVYGALCLLALGALGVSLQSRTPFESNILRARGANGFVLDGSWVRNALELHLVNKNPTPARFHVRVTTAVPAQVLVPTPELELASLADARVPISVSIEAAALKNPVDLEIEVRDDTSGVVKRQRVRFLAPVSRPPIR